MLTARSQVVQAVKHPWSNREGRVTSDITSLSTHAARCLDRTHRSPLWTTSRVAAAYLAKFTHTQVHITCRDCGCRSRPLTYSFYLYKNLKHSNNEILIINIRKNRFQLRYISNCMRPIYSVTVQSLWNKQTMPYIMVMGSLSAPHLSKDEGATVYGLKSEERSTLVRVGSIYLI